MADRGVTWTRKNVFWSTLLTIFGILCFPANPLVLSGIVETGHIRLTYILGWIVWFIGMFLVISPVIMFPRYGGVKKGNSFVHTTRLVDRGIYGIIRHPQYLGGILAIFMTTLLWYPHWLFGVLGFTGSAVVYIGSRKEDRRLVERFGAEYNDYMLKVPGMNFLSGIRRAIRRRRNS